MASIYDAIVDLKNIQLLSKLFLGQNGFPDPWNMGEDTKLTTLGWIIYELQPLEGYLAAILDLEHFWSLSKIFFDQNGFPDP